MSGLGIIHYQTEDSAGSPEMRYLSSCLLADTRRVFGKIVEIRWRPEEGADLLAVSASLPKDVPVLVIGRENVHLGAASLSEMKARVDAGASVVLPGRLAGFPLAAETPIHTLRAFELFEQRVLKEQLESAERRDSHLPVALFSAEFFDIHLRQRPLSTLLTDDGLLSVVSKDVDSKDVAYAGLFHDYVDYYGEVRDDILPMVPEEARDVLEIGCGRGVTGQLLQQRLGCRVTGIELNPEVAQEAAERLHRVIVGNVEHLALEELELSKAFDVVVATELFEHLNYPEDFLIQMKRLLRPGGRIVLSVPNVGHYSIVEDLLAGRWDYLPIGLLCYTHFRFFTRATLESWIHRVGFASHQIIAQTTELPERFELPLGPFEVDRESLRTKGFYVVLTVAS